MTNEALVRRAQAGDIPSREALARRWLSRVYGAALARMRNPADADDLAQEALLRAFRGLAKLKDPARFGPWLLQIVRNAARDQYRRPARPTALGEQDGALEDDGSEPALDGDAVRAWRKLPGDERLVTWLRIMDGLRFEDIAELTGGAKSSVYRTFRKGLARLRKELSRC